jgi:hypothetical protein
MRLTAFLRNSLKSSQLSKFKALFAGTFEKKARLRARNDEISRIKTLLD